VIKDFLHAQIPIALANLRERFLQLKPALAAAADVILAEEGPLRPRVKLEHLAHRRARHESILG
jgi:hypothetical protein